MNLLLWSAQAAVVILVAALFTRVLRSAPPSVRLAIWQLALLACLLTPFIRPWQREVVSVAAATPHKVTAVVASSAAHAAPAGRSFSVIEWLMLILAAGVILRLALLGAGLIRLRAYRRHATPFPSDSFWHVEATLLSSDEVSSPVTFGFLSPVILLPGHFADLAAPLRDAILYHEVLHVRRNDWLFALAEETVRAVLWFHPGIWWAVREIQLAREETVDREVVETLNARDAYVDALLAIAGSPLGFEMAAAPLFLRRGHLKRRVFSIFSEVKMSKTKTVSAFIAGCAALALSCWLVTGALPLKAAPQQVQVMDAAGITVDLNGAHLLHRSAVTYPREAYLKGVQGTVTAQVKVDGSGNVVDAAITAGPDELRKTVIQSVLNWHFAGDAANSTRQVTVAFTMPEGAPAAISAVLPMDPPRALSPRMIPAAPPVPIKSIVVVGLPDAQRDELLAKLPVHVGDTMTAETHASLARVIGSFDEHLIVASIVNDAGEMTLEIRAPGVPTSTAASTTGKGPVRVELSAPGGGGSGLPALEPQSITSTPKAVRVGGRVANANAISQVPPEYPPLALAARVQGDIQFDATIGTDGTVQNLHLLSGPPLLVQAAMRAVQQWTYKPTLLDGQPVPVLTTITVNFTLPN
jgi:TonB family protein